jgi:hypothetical protein
MRRRQLNQPQCFSSGPSQLPNEGPAKSTAIKSLKNSARQPLAELAKHGAGQDSSPGQAVPCQPARSCLTSYTVPPLSLTHCLDRAHGGHPFGHMVDTSPE